MVKLLGIFISSGTQQPSTAGGNDMRALHSCQRLAVGKGQPYNSELWAIPVEYHGGRYEFASAAFQERRAG
jgi:hypothetical protein